MSLLPEFPRPSASAADCVSIITSTKTTSARLRVCRPSIVVRPSRSASLMRQLFAPTFQSTDGRWVAESVVA